MGKSVKREIEFSLSEAEIVDKAMHVAALSKEADRLEAEFKEVAKAHRGKVAELERTVRQELAVIVARKEARTVECELEKDFEKNIVRYLHGGIVVEERAMEAHERQDEMDLEGTSETEADFLDDDDDEGDRIPEPPMMRSEKMSRPRVVDLPEDEKEGAA